MLVWNRVTTVVSAYCVSITSEISTVARPYRLPATLAALPSEEQRQRVYSARWAEPQLQIDQCGEAGWIERVDSLHTSQPHPLGHLVRPGLQPNPAF